MNRLLIKSIEGRILAGIAMFVGIMILIGWVAINEEARMQAFVQQHTGRSIERGAELYASLCSTCHGSQGLGAVNRAPGLNNPHLFGYDPLAEYNDEITATNRVLEPMQERVEELTTELTDVENPPSAERQDEIFAELDELDPQIVELQATITDIEAERDTALLGLSSAIDSGLYPLWTDVAPEDLNQFLATNGTRLGQVGWAGNLHDYIVTTLIHGRPGSNRVYPLSEGGMVAWSQEGGGPLRDDQIEDIAAYILNWDKGDEWTVADFVAVQQFGKPLADGSLPQGPPKEVVGTDVDAILERIETDGIVGDAANGETVYTRSGCGSCHLGGAQAPDTVGTWDRVQNERLSEAQFAGYTGEQYLIESIVLPNDYVVDGYNGVMPTVFGSQLDHQEMADLIEFLKSQ